MSPPRQSRPRRPSLGSPRCTLPFPRPTPAPSCTKSPAACERSRSAGRPGCTRRSRPSPHVRARRPFVPCRDGPAVGGEPGEAGGGLLLKTAPAFEEVGESLVVGLRRGGLTARLTALTPDPSPACGRGEAWGPAGFVVDGGFVVILIPGTPYTIIFVCLFSGPVSGVSGRGPASSPNVFGNRRRPGPDPCSHARETP